MMWSPPRSRRMILTTIHDCKYLIDRRLFVLVWREQPQICVRESGVMIVSSSSEPCCACVAYVFDFISLTVTDSYLHNIYSIILWYMNGWRIRSIKFFSRSIQFNSIREIHGGPYMKYIFHNIAVLIYLFLFIYY